MIPEAQIAAARTRGDVIAAEVALRKVGREQCGLCPFHSEKSPSFYVFADGHFHCFGCGAHGNAISYVMRRRNLDFAAAVRFLLDLPDTPARRNPGQTPIARPRETESGTAERVKAVLVGCGPITETTSAWMYLSLRGLPPRQPALYAHHSLWCSETRQNMRALVAPLTRSDGQVTAIQRIYLLPVIEFDGSDRVPQDNRAPLQVRKKNLGIAGDGAVRLAPAGPILGLAEGLESAIAAAKLYRVSTWATCGAARLGAVGLPAEVREVLIFGDRGAAGEAAAARACEVYRRQGRRCSIVLPDEPYQDMNDMLLRRGA